jgi:hypothetical protein
MFGSIESGKGTEVGEEDSQCGLMGVFERIEPFDEQPLGNARGPGLPRRETARRKRIVEERDFRDAQGLAYVDPAPARDMESFGRGGKPVGTLVDRVSLGRPFRESIAVSIALCSRASRARNGSPSCALSGVMQSQPSMNSVASCRSSRRARLGLARRPPLGS